MIININYKIKTNLIIFFISNHKNFGNYFLMHAFNKILINDVKFKGLLVFYGY